jgi:hypothetical protein
VNKVINALDVLANCSGATYEYTEEQIEAMFAAIETAVTSAKKQFSPKQKDEKEQFTF